MSKFKFTDFLREARRRRVFHVAGLYVIGAWVCLQAADLALPALGIPEGAIRYVWMGAIFGFVISVIFGWRYDVVDGRIVRASDYGDVVDLSLQRTDYVILIVVAVATIVATIGLVGEISKTQLSSSEQPLIDDFDPSSIAVLPFVNMSPDPDNAYFAEGLSEELLSGLARVEGLRVAARTSSFMFKNQNVDIREIGQKLRVANVLEGSVRVAGDTFRITAQLIDSRDGVHRWSATYNRPMSDVFAVQDDISKHIVIALSGSLNIDVESSYPVAATGSPEAYSYYLRGRALIRTFDIWDDRNFEQAIGSLKLAVEVDPSFSDAFVALADAYLRLSEWYWHNYMPVKAEEAINTANDAIKVALELAPRSSEAMRALGMISDDANDKEQAYRQAIAINPNNVDAYGELAKVLFEKGNLDEAATMARKAHELDPLNYRVTDFVGVVLVSEGKLKEASVYFQLATEQRLANDADNTEWLTAISKCEILRDRPGNLDFEKEKAYWKLQKQCSENYSFAISNDSYTGQRSGHLFSLPESVGACDASQVISAKEYAGQYIRLVGMIKTRSLSGHAKLWLATDGANGPWGYVDGWPNFVAEDTDWTEYDLRLYVPKTALFIRFGAVLNGEGEMWIDDLRVEAFDNPDFQ